MIRTMFMLFALTSLIATVVQAAPGDRQARPGSTPKPATSSAVAAATPGAPVNVNTASATEFEALPGIGAKTAARIIEYRQKNGPFKKIEELMNVRGLGEKNFLKLKGQLTLGTPKATDK